MLEELLLLGLLLQMLALQASIKTWFLSHNISAAIRPLAESQLPLLSSVPTHDGSF